ncbi:alanine racemase C-terminal domain-containing protein [Nocardioides sp. NPDC000441]|uniref:alanine racemase n=1 Tax=Nocardioides sp. NPDC000441 TaxID=3154256 RepID=UPI0033327349
MKIASSGPSMIPMWLEAKTTGPVAGMLAVSCRRTSNRRPIEAGAGVSYNHTWVAEEPTTVGLIPVGYAEGIQRRAGNRAEVWIDGARYPVRGTICMDQIVVDLGDASVERGAEVLLWGTGADGEPTAQDWAEASETIAYEVVTRIGGRMKRRYVDTDVDTEQGDDT